MRIKTKIFVTVFMLVAISTSIYFLKNDISHLKERAEEKVLYSDALMMSTCPVSLETGYHMSDIVIKGKIVDIYQRDVDFLISAGDKLGEDIPKITCTYYSVKVEDTYLGEIDNNIITYREVGGFDEFCTKPKEKTEVILMLNERIDVDTHEKVYVSTMQEHSIITIDNGRMYSYSNTEELSAFDGKDAEEFEKAFEKVKKQNNYKQDKTMILSYQ